ncbi:TPA: hypothetical protein N0F65_006060 [Lagenidium giganteum]|uniref:Uncharacterized protein n=1 Tax=Lagenidium giganteum TaxID=4803 RepID=A0AAV2YNJ9_9STRA|nr:TPA: hypothetical protein N0F65_006060 [Lagenidium giganteum]
MIDEHRADEVVFMAAIDIAKSFLGGAEPVMSSRRTHAVRGLGWGSCSILGRRH